MKLNYYGILANDKGTKKDMILTTDIGFALVAEPAYGHPYLTHNIKAAKTVLTNLKSGNRKYDTKQLEFLENLRIAEMTLSAE